MTESGDEIAEGHGHLRASNADRDQVIDVLEGRVRPGAADQG